MIDIKQLEDEIYNAKGQWFVVNCQTGHEEKVKSDLLSRIKSDNLENQVFDVKIAQQKVLITKELKSGETKKEIKDKNKFPGYIFINMNMSEKTWFVIRNNPGVTGFIGSSGRGAKPFPLSVEEVINMLVPEEETITIDEVVEEVVKETATVTDNKPKGVAVPKKELFTANFQVGDTVRIKEGIHTGEEGKVQDMDYSKGVAFVSIEMFGRYTTLEIQFDQVETF